MFQKSFSKTYRNVDLSLIWQAWADVSNWPKWDKGLDYCEIKDEFRVGTRFILKPKDGQKVKITLHEVIENDKFTDTCQFVGAIMFDEHVLEETENGVKITNSIIVKGLLAFLWRHLVAKNVAKSMPAQTDNLVDYVRKLK